jgi:hypothetical protein
MSKTGCGENQNPLYFRFNKCIYILKTSIRVLCFMPAMFLLSCALTRPRSGCRTPAHESQTPCTFIASVHSQFELINMKLKKVNQNCLLFLGAYKFNVCYGPFSKIAAPFRLGLPKPTQLLHLHPRFRGNVACQN